MNSKIDWKNKYQELRSKYLNAIDVAFKMGVEEGMRNAEMEQLQQQVADMEQEQAMAEEAAMMGGEGMVDEAGMPIEGEEMPMDEEMPMEGMEGEELPQEEGDDMGQSIDELESFVKKEKPFDARKLMKSIHKSEVKKTSKTTNKKQDKINKMFAKK